MRLEGNAQIDGRPRTRVAVVFPTLGNGVPRVLRPHVVPMFGGRMGNAKRGGDEDEQQREQKHSRRDSGVWVRATGQ